jgi:hypothetical protein
VRLRELLDMTPIDDICEECWEDTGGEEIVPADAPYLLVECRLYESPIAVFAAQCRRLVNQPFRSVERVLVNNIKRTTVYEYR